MPSIIYSHINRFNFWFTKKYEDDNNSDEQIIYEYFYVADRTKEETGHRDNQTKCILWFYY